MAPPIVQVNPVAPPTLPYPPVVVIAPPVEAPPYNAAVAARFAPPPVSYNTPGLQAGRNTYTSNTEVGSWLRTQAAVAARNSAVRSQVLAIGRTQRGQDIDALILTRSLGTDAASMLASGRPTVLLIGQQQGDEPAGAEALLVIARELAQGLLQPLLEHINVVIVPRANPDGADANTAATAGGQDLSRDQLLLNSPEAQALARLTRDYRPAAVVDAHEYDPLGRVAEKLGAIAKADARLQYATAYNLPEFLTKAAEEWYRRPALTALRSQGLGSEWAYSTSDDPTDKKISMAGPLADSSRNVNGLKNSVSLLIESRGTGLGRMHLQRRVHTQVTAISSLLASTAQRAPELAQLLPYIDKEVIGMACREEAVIEAASAPGQHELQMLDPVTGADRPIKVDWESALAPRKLKARTRPCGYLLDEASTIAVERLRMHGLLVQRVSEPGAVLADRYTESTRNAALRTSSPADQQVQVSLQRSLVEVPRGSYYVPLNQSFASLAIAALEPDAPGSFFAGAILPDLASTVRVMAPPSMKFEDLP
jgi:hypothetical protein